MFERVSWGFVQQSMNAEKDSKRKELLKEFFLNATLIALIKELGRETAQLEHILHENELVSDDPMALESWAPQPAA